MRCVAPLVILIVWALSGPGVADELLTHGDVFTSGTEGHHELYWSSGCRTVEMAIFFAKCALSSQRATCTIGTAIAVLGTSMDHIPASQDRRA